MHDRWRAAVTRFERRGGRKSWRRSSSRRHVERSKKLCLPWVQPELRTTTFATSGARANAHGTAMFLFRRVPQRVMHDPPTPRGTVGFDCRSIGFIEPAFAHVDGRVQVIFGHIAQVIGDGATHIQLWIILEQFQERQGERRILLEFGQPSGPRQTWSSPFAHQPPHVRIGIASPVF